jgi:hypothetical protein
MKYDFFLNIQIICMILKMIIKFTWVDIREKKYLCTYNLRRNVLPKRENGWIIAEILHQQVENGFSIS